LVHEIGSRMILTPFDTVKRHAHMSVAHSNGVHTS
jgi:hypothetical protein